MEKWRSCGTWGKGMEIRDLVLLAIGNTEPPFASAVGRGSLVMSIDYYYYYYNYYSDWCELKK